MTDGRKTKDTLKTLYVLCTADSEDVDHNMDELWSYSTDIFTKEKTAKEEMKKRILSPEYE